MWAVAVAFALMAMAVVLMASAFVTSVLGVRFQIENHYSKASSLILVALSLLLMASASLSIASWG